MIMTTTETVAGKQITEVKGLVTSSIVQSRHIGKDLLAGLKSVVGGELKSYTEMLEDSKKAVKERLIREAEQLGANAIAGLRFELTAGQNTSELIGYGTAVTIESM
ncbi:YbjQ family protein [Bacillus siamensis]|uniref:YbjQ family protein n=1 Tax=Bacillus siamensis TaxID=659243 RepID=UPI002DB57A08|nr:YbjQ family protein [Bacillus siamensis]MEC3654157.1 YbjQ family protein [Bacillus siamensis]